MINHQTGDVTQEPFTARDYPMHVVWGLKEQGFAYVPAGWPKSAARAALLGAVARAAEANEPCTKRVSAAITEVRAQLHHAFDLRPEDVAEDVAAWALADSLLADLIERAYARNHGGRPD